jgi:AmiR/NasT family two-component response regulator
MGRYKLTADRAFQLLARASMDSNRKVRDIADDLVHTGQFPTGGRGAGRPPGNGA